MANCINCNTVLTVFNETYPLWDDTNERFCSRCSTKYDKFLNKYNNPKVTKEFISEHEDQLRKLGFSSSGINYIYESVDGIEASLKKREKEREISRQRAKQFNNCLICGREVSSIITGKITLKDGSLCKNCYENLGFSIKLDSLAFLGTTPNYSLEQITAIGQKIKDDEAFVSTFHATYSPAKVAMFNDDNQKMVFSPRIRLSYSASDYVVFDYNQLIDFSLLEDGASIASGGIGRAVIGGILFGGTGAIVGGLTRGQKGTCTSMQIKLTVKDYYVPAFFIPIIAGEVKKNSLVYKNSITIAESILSKLQLIANTLTEQESRATSVSHEEKDVPDQIRKYKSLLDDGIITNEEFEAKKRELLGL